MSLDKQKDSRRFSSKAEHDRAGTPTLVAATCTYGGESYNEGDHVCINHDDYQCGKNGWFKTGNKC